MQIAPPSLSFSQRSALMITTLYKDRDRLPFLFPGWDFSYNTLYGFSLFSNPKVVTFVWLSTNSLATYKSKNDVKKFNRWGVWICLLPRCITCWNFTGFLWRKCLELSTYAASHLCCLFLWNGNTTSGAFGEFLGENRRGAINTCSCVLFRCNIIFCGWGTDLVTPWMKDG